MPTADGGAASIVGIAKGVGMIEPDMATLLAFFFTDADVDAGALDASFRRVIDRTFNARQHRHRHLDQRHRGRPRQRRRRPGRPRRVRAGAR